MLNPAPGEPNWPSGKDGPVPGWLSDGVSPVERPRFDSVVVRGNGVGALVFAARLARSEAFRGRLRIVAARPQESRVLINGCTLRARSLDYYAAAFGTSPTSLLDELFPTRLDVAETHEQRFALAVEPRLGEFRLRPLTRWMGAPDPSAHAVFAYGLRNSHLVGRLTTRLEALGVEFHNETAESLNDLRALAGGSRPLIVNANHRPLAGAPSHPAPARFVVASQVPLRRREDAALPRNSSFISMRRRAGAFDTGVFYPFVDPLTPEANLYGIFYRIVRPSGSFDKSREIATMRRCVEGVAQAAGCDPVAANEARGEAMVPCLPWQDVTSPREDWFDLHRTYSACTPIITGDGMTRAGLAGWMAAEAVLAGQDPVVATNRSLEIWRRTNHGFAWAMTRLCAFTEPLLRHAPQMILGSVGRAPDMWASIH